MKEIEIEIEAWSRSCSLGVHFLMMAEQVGKEETESFAKNQEVLERQGKPHCKKIERNLGRADGHCNHSPLKRWYTACK